MGEEALAAVGTAGPILNLLIVLFMGIATGASILSAQYFGAKDREQLSRALRLLRDLLIGDEAPPSAP